MCYPSFMITPRPCGSFLELDEHGHVIKKASPDLIPHKWKGLVREVTRLYGSYFGSNLHSVWLRGSVANGQAEDGAADLDTFAYLIEEADWPTGIDAEIRELQTRHPHCTWIETIAMPVAELEHDRVWARIIKTQAVCLHGEDIGSRIPPHSLRDMIHYSRYLRFNLEKKLPLFLAEDAGDPRELCRTCSWTAKLLLRSLYETIMLKEGRWTNDLWPCYERFSAHHAGREMQTMELLQLCLNPVADEKRLAKAVAAFVPWIYDEVRAQLGVESDATY